MSYLCGGILTYCIVPSMDNPDYIMKVILLPPESQKTLYNSSQRQSSPSCDEKTELCVLNQGSESHQKYFTALQDEKVEGY